MATQYRRHSSIQYCCCNIGCGGAAIRIHSEHRICSLVSADTPEYFAKHEDRCFQAAFRLLSLFISNVGAAVILFPIVIGIAPILGIDTRPLVLLVAVSAANSFILPTHQVNALLKTAGGYRNSDYLKAGWGLRVLFTLITTGVFYLLYI